MLSKFSIPSIVAKNWTWFLPSVLALFFFISWQMSEQKIETLKSDVATEQAERKADQETMRAAQWEARVKNIEAINRIKKDAERVTERVVNEYETDLAELRRTHSSRMRDLQRRAASGDTRGPATGGVPDTSEGTDGTSQVCISPGEYLYAGEIELRLDALQQWVTEQSEVPRN